MTHSSLLPSDTFLHPLREIVRRAGDIAASFFRLGERTPARLWTKNGGSPVTEADIAVDGFLRRELTMLVPEAAWLSEETADNKERLGNPHVWIVDPIDGTRGFLSGHPDWCLSVALVTEGAPVIGIVYAPTRGLYYEAIQGQGAFCNGERLGPLSVPDRKWLRVAGPKFLVDRLQAGLDATTECSRVPAIPSLAMRLARLADASIDAALVSTDASDWDIAAGQLLLAETGGRMTGRDGAQIRFNQPNIVHGELIAAEASAHARLLVAMERAELEPDNSP